MIKVKSTVLLVIICTAFQTECFSQTFSIGLESNKCMGSVVYFSIDTSDSDGWGFDESKVKSITREMLFENDLLPQDYSSNRRPDNCHPLFDPGMLQVQIFTTLEVFSMSVLFYRNNYFRVSDSEWLSKFAPIWGAPVLGHENNKNPDKIYDTLRTQLSHFIDQYKKSNNL